MNNLPVLLCVYNFLSTLKDHCDCRSQAFKTGNAKTQAVLQSEHKPLCDATVLWRNTGCYKKACTVCNSRIGRWHSL